MKPSRCPRRSRTGTAIAVLACGLVLNAGAAGAVMPGEGNRVLFSRWPAGGQPQVLSMSVHGTKVDRLTAPGSGGLAALNGHWSPDGEAIAYLSGTTQADVFVMGAHGSHERQLTDTRRNEFWPAWSPNGARISYVSERFDQSGQTVLMVMDADGRNASPILVTSAFNPGWRPSGGSILAYSGSDGSDWEIYTVRRNGRQQIQLTDDGVDQFFMDWSADSTRILYVENGDLFSMAADGTDPQPITSSGDVRSGLYLPSGRVLSERLTPSGSDVWIQRDDGSHRRRLTNNPAQNILVFRPF